MSTELDYTDEDPPIGASPEVKVNLARRALRKSAEYVKLQDYLQLANTKLNLPAVPVITGDLSILKGAAGSNNPFPRKPKATYATISESLPGGLVAIDVDTTRDSPANIRGTVMHEFVHAAQDRMGKQVNTKGATSPRFKDAYRKLGLDGESLVKAISSSWVKQDRADTRSRYRTTQPEIAAFGASNFVAAPSGSPGPAPSYPAPAHVDATAATEFAILLDLATRELRKPQK
jgi:hypothetical protein